MPRLAAFPHRALVLAALSFAPFPSAAQENAAGIGRIEVADPTRPSDGTVHPAALAAQLHGPLPVSAYTAALDRALEKELRRAAPDLALSTRVAKRDPNVGRQSLGLRYFGATPSGTSGAKGPDRYVQVVNRLAGLYDVNLQLIQERPLTTLGGLDPSVPMLNPQCIWSAPRHFCLASYSAGADENGVSINFTRDPPGPSNLSTNETAYPNNLSANWCHYVYVYASRYLNNLSLGDNKDFIIFTGNAFQPGFVGADINAISKPPPGPGCPAPNSFKTGLFGNIRDSEGVLASSPVAANQIDDLPTGYVAARHGSGILALPSNKLWLFNVTRNPADGKPLFSSARQLTVPTYGVPPVAQQPDSRRLHTLDARLTQAVQARNPGRPAGVFSFWTQHTVRHPTQDRSIVRWYKIDPGPSPPVVLRTGTIGEEPAHAGRFFYNAAISPDRQVDGATKRFGNSFVVTYNFSSSTISPGIGAASSVNGNPLTFRTVQNGVAPYLDLSCPNASNVCQWAGASASPDPRPDPARPRPTRGVVWGAHQYSGDPTPDPARTDWRTRIFAIQP